MSRNLLGAGDPRWLALVLLSPGVGVGGPGGGVWRGRHAHELLLCDKICVITGVRMQPYGIATRVTDSYPEGSK